MTRTVLQVVIPSVVTWALFNWGGGGEALRVWAWRLYADGTFVGMVEAADVRALSPVTSWDEEFFFGYVETDSYDYAQREVIRRHTVRNGFELQPWHMEPKAR